MNPKLKNFLTISWNDPRAFFFGLLLLCLLPFAVTVIVVQSQNRPSGVVLLIASIAVVGAVMALVGFVLSWIPPMRRLFERLLRRRFFYLACLITLVALFYTVENWRGQRAWEKHRKGWEAKGEKFNLVSLAPPPVPDEQNFAMTPLFKTALEFRRVRPDTNALAHLENISTSLPSERGGNESLPLGNLAKGNLADLAACREFYRSNTNYPQPANSGTAAADILVALGKFDADINELREAAANRPYSRFPISYDLEPSTHILLPHLSHLKRLILVVNLRTIAELEVGQTQNAFKDLQLSFRLTDAIKGEPILMNHLVRIATLAIPLQGLREGLSRHAWDDPQLAALEQYLGSVNLLAEYKQVIRGERIFSTSALDYLRRHRFTQDVNQFTGEIGVATPIGPVFPGGWFYQNMLAISEMHQDSVLACVEENARRVFPVSNQRLEMATATLVNSRFHPYRVFASMLFPAVAKATLKAAHMQTFVDEARVACGLERYRLANGKFPKKLEAIVPRFIAAIPNDVMDGQPLRYRTAPDGGYVIYSIGWNAKDDGGGLALSRSGKNVNTEEGDWVWKYPAN